jgi:hypothetical protein
MSSKLTLFAAACVASLALSTSASAATILAFSQQTSTDFVQAVVSGSTTTLSTHGPAATPLSIPITITQEGNAQNVSVAAFETFSPSLVSNVAPSANPSGGPIQNGFNGTIIISQNSASNPAGLGNIFLTAVITNGRLEANGQAGGFNASSFTTNGGIPVTVTLTSPDPNIAPLLSPPGGPSPGAVALSLVNIVPAQTGAAFTSFTAQNTGNFSTVSPIPEPASIVSASTAVLVGLGCFGWSRRKSSKA